MLLQVSGVGLLVAALITLGLAVSAGATGPADGTIVPGAAAATGSFTVGIPFASGQNINVVIPANSDFAAPNNTKAVNVVECSAPNGVIPTQTAACDGNTIQLQTILPSADGSFTYSNYTVYALPDSTTLGEQSGGPACGQTAPTECILYIGNNQLDFTQPHFWSQPFFIAPSVGDAGTPAGDGSAPPAATLPDPTKSTVVASPSTATADGVDQSTVTVTLNSSGSLPVAGKAVTLSPSCTPSPCATSFVGPTPTSTGSNGQATFTVTDTVAQTVTVTAKDTTDTPNVALTTTPTITFQAPVVSSTHSTVTANPTTVSAGNSTTITVTLRDQGAVNPQPIANDDVTLAQASGHALITPAATPNKTNAQGVATFTATDTTSETVTFTATDATSNTVISNTAAVTFGTLIVSATQSTVTAPTPAPVGSGGTAVVTLLTSTNSPVPGKAVSLQASSGTAVIGAPSQATTDANGQIQFTVKDSVAEPVTLTATDTTDGITLTQMPTVTFETSSPSATASKMLVQATTAPADGETQILITVLMKDQFSAALSDKTVTLQEAPAGDVQVHPIGVGSSLPGVTDSTGTAEFEADDTHAETVTFTATDTTDNVVLSQTVSITFVHLPADPTAIGTTVTASPTNPLADGTTPSTITVTLTDFFSNPVAGSSITLKALNGSSSINPASSVTDQNGQSTFSATDATAEIVTYQATDTTDGNAVLAAEAVVKFGNPPAPPPDAAYCSVVANPTSVPADGTHAATVSVLLYDGNGDPVTGKAVSLAGSGGNSRVAATNATTNNSGMATFAVSDSTAESVRYTATDTTDSISLSAIQVTVTFTAASSTTTTTTAPSGTTTTTTATNAAAAGTTLAGSSTSGTTGNTGTGSGSPTLAATGASRLLPWLVGLGTLFLGIGTSGRRRFKWTRPVDGGRNDV
jgi:hypothetical protein